MAQVLFSDSAVIGGDTGAVMRVFAGFDLVDEIAHRQRMFLRGAENDGLFPLVDHIHEQLDTVFLPLFYFDHAVKIIFDIPPAFLDFTLYQLIVGGIDVFIQRGGDLFDLERGREPSLIPSFRE